MWGFSQCDALLRNYKGGVKRIQKLKINQARTKWTVIYMPRENGNHFWSLRGPMRYTSPWFSPSQQCHDYLLLWFSLPAKLEEWVGAGRGYLPSSVLLQGFLAGVGQLLVKYWCLCRPPTLLVLLICESEPQKPSVAFHISQKLTTRWKKAPPLCCWTTSLHMPETVLALQMLNAWVSSKSYHKKVGASTTDRFH